MGWGAASKIRNSNGQLYGMGAALTAALLPTALLVIGLLIFAIAGVLYLIRESGASIEPERTNGLISRMIIEIKELGRRRKKREEEEKRGEGERKERDKGGERVKRRTGER